MSPLHSSDNQQRLPPHDLDNQGENELVTWVVVCDDNEDQLRGSVSDESSEKKIPLQLNT
jgi:hypothetical protein